MKRLIVICCFIICLTSWLSANSSVVVDIESKQPLKLAQVSIWTASNKQLSLHSDCNGNVNIPENAYKIRIKLFGYGDKTIENYNRIIPDTIFLEKGYLLKEIEVSAVKHNFHIKSDRYIYDVNSDSTLIDKSTIDALQRIPILNVTPDDNIQSLQGKNIIFKINGLINPLISGDLRAALRTLKANYVKQIEIKENPKGDSPNTLEIDIITKGRLEGYMANSSLSLKDYGIRPTIWGLTKINKLCLSGSYYYMMNRDHDIQTVTTEDRILNDKKISYLQNSNEGGYKANLNNMEISMSYDIDDNTILSAFGRILNKRDPNISSSTHTIIRSDKFNDLIEYNQTSQTNFDDNEYSGNVNFEKLFGRNADKGKLFIGYDFYRRPNDSYTKVGYNVTLCNDSSFLPQLPVYIRHEYVDLTMHTTMMEFRYNLRPRHTFFANATYRYRLDTNKDSLGLNEEDMQLRQNLTEGSIAYKYASDRLSLHLGLGMRLYNDNISNSKFGPEYTFNRSNLIWQPTISFAWSPSDSQRYEFTYSLNSYIPGIRALNPFVFQDEPTRRSFGNPNLKPERNHNLSIGGNFQLRRIYLGASLTGQYSSDLILQYSFLDENQILNTTYDNIANRWNFGCSSFMRWNISRSTSMRTNMGVNWISYNSPRLKSKNSGMQFNGKITISQELPLDIWSEIFGQYNTPWINFQGKGGENFGYGISMSRGFLRNKLRVSLSAENFIPTYYTRSYITQYENYNSVIDKRMFHAYYSLNISYSFGNIRANVKQTESSISNKDIKKAYDE